ncbi:MAG: biotin transporter BioY, partial [Clostridiales bacterium]|nr:biotin transporter BioY [Clostridiales bacterium]
MNTRRLVSIAVFTALIIVGGLVSVPIPFTQIQLSFQTLFIIMAGLVLGARDGALSVLIYLAMGLLGLPVFTNGGGIGYVFMPSFGYLIGFPIGAFVAGMLNSRGKKATRSRAFASALVGMIPVYIVGMTYQVLILYYYTGIEWAAAIGGLPAVLVLAVKDAVLLGIVASVYPAIMRALRSMGHG